MAEELEKSVSVIVPTLNGNDMVYHYLPQLCAHISECATIVDYEVIICDDSSESETIANIPHVRHLKVNPSLSQVECLNTALYAASKPFVLVMKEGFLPSFDYFSELLSLFHYVPSLLGASANTLSSYNNMVEGPKTIDHAKWGIHLKTLDIQSQKPVYSLSLSNTNMIFNRKQLCMMGGFSPMFKDIDVAKDELCIKAWRSGRKCMFTSSTHCKKTGSVDDKPQETPTIRNNNDIYNSILINYLHTTRLKHLFFWIRFIFHCLTRLVSMTSTAKAYMGACGKFFRNYRKLHIERRWYKNQHNTSVDNVVKGFFSGEKLHEVSIKKKQ